MPICAVFARPLLDSIYFAFLIVFDNFNEEIENSTNPLTQYFGSAFGCVKKQMGYRFIAG